MDNNNPAQQNNVAPGPNPVPAPRPVQQNRQDRPKPPAQTGLTRARDNLLNNDRVTSFGLTTRKFARSFPFNVNFAGNLVDLYSALFQGMWNQGFNSIVPAVAAGAVLAACQDYARCYIHYFLCDLYSSIREVAQKESPIVFLANYNQEMPRTGHQYDPFLRQVFNMLHPILCDKALEETLYYPRFELNMERNHDNWFNLPGVGANTISERRIFAIVDTLNRSKTVNLGALQFGTTRGSGAALVDFYPRNDDGAKEYAAIWLNMDNNYNDDGLTVMYVVGQDYSTERLGPFYDAGFENDEAARNALNPPFEAEFIVEEDDDEMQLNAYFVDAAGNRVEDYNDARDQHAEYIRRYTRVWYMYRKKVLQTINPTDRYSAFKQIVEG